MRLGVIAKKALQRRGALIALLLVSAIFMVSKAGVSAVGLNNIPNGILVSPVVEETTVSKGQTASIPMSIQNPTNFPVTLKAIINDFVANNNESGVADVILNTKNAKLPLNNFESLVSPIANITLSPQQRLYFNVSISVPSNAASGGYYGIIRFQNATTTTTANIGLGASTGTLFLVTVPGNLTYKVNLVQFYVEHGSSPTGFLTSGNVSVVTRLDNVGNIHVQPFGTIQIENTFHKVISTIQFNSTNPRSNIPPDSIRKFTNALPKQHYLGHYTLIASIAWQSGSGNIIIATVGFWYLPVWFIALVVLVIVVIVLVIWLIIHRYRVNRRRYRH
jgi:hypothetical protein